MRGAGTEGLWPLVAYPQHGGEVMVTAATVVEEVAGEEEKRGGWGLGLPQTGEGALGLGLPQTVGWT